MLDNLDISYVHKFGELINLKIKISINLVEGRSTLNPNYTLDMDDCILERQFETSTLKRRIRISLTRQRRLHTWAITSHIHIEYLPKYTHEGFH